MQFGPLILNLWQVSEGEEGDEGEEGEEEEEDDTVYMYIPPEPKDWISLGSEKEIEESSVKETRRKVMRKHVS